MDLRTFLVITCLCLEVFISFVSGTKLELKTGATSIGEKEGVPLDTGDVIMKEDAQEVFYSVDFDRYEGVKCQPPETPENGIIVGEGNEVGSVVYVQCKDGYYLSGPTVMACSPVNGDVKWDPDVGRECIKGETYFQESHSVEKEPQESFEQHDKEEDAVTAEDFPPPFPINSNRHSFHMPSRWDQHEGELKVSGSLDEMRRRVELEDLLPSKCHLKPEKGPCEASFRRFYFDKSTMECAEFFYGGCEGNENKFDTLADCNHACLRKLP